MKARFFCESCGAEVRHSEKICPSCGKTFTAVRCPRCGFEGMSREFARGCPGCGYLNVIPPDDGGARRGTDAERAPREVHGVRLPRVALSNRFYRIAIIALVGVFLALVALLAAVLASG